MLTVSNRPGTYVLVLYCATDGLIAVGRLGEIRFSAGWYAYVGSAFGPGGLRGRLKHHLHPLKTCHWHVDYLRSHAAVREVWTNASGRRFEHRWASALAGLCPAARPIPRFGCSDCSCPSHLVHFEQYPGHHFKRAIPGAGLALKVDDAGIVFR
jgi:Uri superfamily endonuclease